jgi:tetratricopeptide (TPR) repeat protein
MSVSAPPVNPYIAGRALGQGRGFFGRDDILRLVEARLTTPDQGAIVLFGQRRIGKTSILLQLLRRLPSPPFVPVYFDLMDRARQPLGTVLHDIAATLAAEAGMPAPEPAPFDQRGVFFRQSFLPALYDTIGTDRIPVLLFDEFDVLDIAAGDQITHSAAAHTFFPYLRELLENEPRLKFIFVVGRRAEDLSINVKSIFKATIYQRVSVLDDASARELVRTAQRQGTLGFSRAVVDRILALTAGHPYLTQLLCQILWDTAYAGNPSAPPSIQQIEQVEAAATRVLEAGENIFEWIWDGLPPAERVIFAAIAAATDEHSVVGEEQLTQLLQSQGVRILTRELELAPRTLVEWEMLRQVDGGYRFFIELMRRWVATRKPLPRVKEELDRIIPLADTLYRSADGFYRQRELENAKSLLLQALRVNPNHLKARLLLGQVLLEQEKLDEAVKELEEAYKNDEDAARYQLIRALLARGQEHERSQQPERALVVYNRALAISPREKVAIERRAALLVARGDDFLQHDNLDAALEAYQEAGAAEKIATVHTIHRRREVGQLVADAEQCERDGEWAQALDFYNRLQQREPDEVRWRDAVVRIGDVQRRELLERVGEQASFHEQLEEWDTALELYTRLADESGGQQHWLAAAERVRGEQELARRYNEGLAALGRGDRNQALQSFAAVLQNQVDYKDAADRLTHILERRPRRGALTGRLAGAWLRTLIPALLAMLFATALGFQLSAVAFLGVYVVVMLVVGAVMLVQEWLIGEMRERVVLFANPRAEPRIQTHSQWLALVGGLSGIAALGIGAALDAPIHETLTVKSNTPRDMVILPMMAVAVGVVTGIAQWWALRRIGVGMSWIAATTGATMLAGLVIARADQALDVPSAWFGDISQAVVRAAVGATAGSALVGAVQAFALRGHVATPAHMLWLTALSGGFAMALLTQSRVSGDEYNAMLLAAACLIVLLFAALQWRIVLRPGVSFWPWLAAGGIAPLAGAALAVGYVEVTGVARDPYNNHYAATLLITCGIWLVFATLLARLLRELRPAAHGNTR